jgi:uncharacterized protein related to proFAR isomerase
MVHVSKPTHDSVVDFCKYIRDIDYVVASVAEIGTHTGISLAQINKLATVSTPNKALAPIAHFYGGGSNNTNPSNIEINRNIPNVCRSVKVSHTKSVTSIDNKSKIIKQDIEFVREIIKRANTIMILVDVDMLVEGNNMQRKQFIKTHIDIWNIDWESILQSNSTTDAIFQDAITFIASTNNYKDRSLYPAIYIENAG